MLALSIRQPYAELILRGVKRIEYRSRPTRIVGERFWIYAAKGGVRRQETARREGEGVRREGMRSGGEGAGDGGAEAWGTGDSTIHIQSQIANRKSQIESDDLVVVPPPPWMVELANAIKLFPHELPTGVIVGSAVIERVTEVEREMTQESSSLSTIHSPLSTLFEWHLTDVRRIKTPRKPKGHPQPVWWRPG